MFPRGSATGRPANCAGHRLLDQARLARAGTHSRFLDRAFFHIGDAARNAENNATVGTAVPVGLGEEATEHLFGHLEIGDDPMSKRPQCPDPRRCPPDHPPRLVSDRVNVAGRLVDGDHRRLEEDDAFTANIDDGVGRAEVDGHIAATIRRKVARDAHDVSFHHGGLRGAA
jgi:hypothetical protein